ncbi:MAG TPA: sigma-70 family RNA polymerase sigma factor [Thermoanaerobaculia bacterium]|nr:sigma-70 family RNA polymerase sigma factor [Thermoanaerobaculia bacterium]
MKTMEATTDGSLPPGEDVTRLLLAWRDGNEQALARLMPLVYDELRRLAASYMRRERSDHTLQPTALLNEAYLRLIDQTRVAWQGRAHFFGIAARMMRRILMDHARQHRAAKRGSGGRKLPLDEAMQEPLRQDVDLLALDEALTRLEELDPRQSRVVELRFFAGLEVTEVAEVLGISPATVKREWAVARAWLHREIADR